MEKYRKKYYLDNKTVISAKNRKWYEDNIEIAKIYRQKKYQEDKETILFKHRQWCQTTNGKIANRKRQAKRRHEFGYIVLNQYGVVNPEYVGHHLDKINVLYIPKELHKSISHRQSNKQSMHKINTAAIDWYMKQKGVVIKWTDQ